MVVDGSRSLPRTGAMGVMGGRTRSTPHTPCNDKRASQTACGETQDRDGSSWPCEGCAEVSDCCKEGGSKDAQVGGGAGTGTSSNRTSVQSCQGPRDLQGRLVIELSRMD